MRILVLNGSPKGKNSITLQTIEYLKIRFPQHEWETLHVGQLIALYEKDFTKARAALDRAELIIFSYPVYTFIAPYQLHRFVELMKEHRVDVSGKWASQLSTSKHFYDVTAHRYVMENAQDMGMKFVRGLSADMDDLTTKKGREEAEAFFRYLMFSVESGSCEPSLPVQPAPAHVPATQAESTGEKTGDVVILTDVRPEDTQLQGMIDRFRAVCPKKTRVINLREYPFKGGCLGCFGCAKSGKCVYPGGFDEFLRNDIQKAEAEVHAFSISDHGMSAVFKCYSDRQFCNGHRTVRMGAPIGYIVSGNYKYEENLRMIVEGRAEVGGNFLCGVATDEDNTDAAIDRLAKTLAWAMDHKHTQPKNFLGVGGMRIFRDLIWLMQGLMKEDHRFFKKHGQYDFPQKQRGRMMAMYLVGFLMGNEKLKKKAGSKMTEGMLMPYAKVLKQARKESGLEQ
ncbi:MAG: NAD(P)H-dependent oxidoreductase [Clostridia bacterium]|nr:NAD(P)H-dependent oxidoreductase [Clostridia bacterium]